jgi:hypothetical protein
MDYKKSLSTYVGNNGDKLSIEQIFEGPSWVKIVLDPYSHNYNTKSFDYILVEDLLTIAKMCEEAHRLFSEDKEND